MNEQLQENQLRKINTFLQKQGLAKYHQIKDIEFFEETFLPFPIISSIIDDYFWVERNFASKIERIGFNDWNIILIDYSNDEEVFNKDFYNCSKDTALYKTFLEFESE